MILAQSFWNFYTRYQLFGLYYKKLVYCLSSMIGEAVDKTADINELEKQRKEIGRRLASARKAKGYTQEQIAKMFGISQTAYQKFEYGREIKATMLVKLCTILECSPSWLLGMKEDGQHLAPEDPIMVKLRATCERLNDKGKRKVVSYAEDLSFNPDMAIEVKSIAVPNNRVSGVA